MGLDRSAADPAGHWLAVVVGAVGQTAIAWAAGCPAAAGHTAAGRRAGTDACAYRDAGTARPGPRCTRPDLPCALRAGSRGLPGLRAGVHQPRAYGATRPPGLYGAAAA